MLRFTIERIMMMIPTLIAVSVLIFLIIELPEGDILSNRIDDQCSINDISVTPITKPKHIIYSTIKHKKATVERQFVCVCVEEEKKKDPFIERRPPISSKHLLLYDIRHLL